MVNVEQTGVSPRRGGDMAVLVTIGIHNVTVRLYVPKRALSYMFHYTSRVILPVTWI